MQAQANIVTFNVEGAALAFGNDFVFLDEPIGRLAERLFLLDLSPAVLSPELQVPILGKFFGARKAVLLRAHTSIFAGQIGGALPILTVFPLVDMELAAHE